MTPEETAKWKIEQLDKQFLEYQLEVVERQLRIVQEKMAILKEFRCQLEKMNTEKE